MEDKNFEYNVDIWKENNQFGRNPKLDRDHEKKENRRRKKRIETSWIYRKTYRIEKNIF